MLHLVSIARWMLHLVLFVRWMLHLVLFVRWMLHLVLFVRWLLHLVLFVRWILHLVLFVRWILHLVLFVRWLLHLVLFVRWMLHLVLFVRWMLHLVLFVRWMLHLVLFVSWMLHLVCLSGERCTVSDVAVAFIPGCSTLQSVHMAIQHSPAHRAYPESNDVQVLHRTDTFHTNSADTMADWVHCRGSAVPQSCVGLHNTIICQPCCHRYCSPRHSIFRTIVWYTMDSGEQR